MEITSVEVLRALFPPPRERSVRKQLASLDVHCTRFIGLSPFLILATASTAGALDASPRGGAPGFVKLRDSVTLLIPDSPGNNRLDSFTNIIDSRQAGLLFLVPGVDETLRVNGEAVLSTAAEDISRCADDRRAPKLVVRLTVREAYLHCAKALMRSSLWSAASQVDRSVLPSMGQMLKDQIGWEAPAETQEEMVKRYTSEL